MKQKFTLEREFIKWFYEEPYPGLGSNRSHVQAMGMPAVNINVRDYWMRDAYKQGAVTMAQEVLDILASWACAVEGLDPETIEPCEVFDRARENLYTYVTKQLELPLCE